RRRRRPGVHDRLRGRRRHGRLSGRRVRQAGVDARLPVRAGGQVLRGRHDGHADRGRRPRVHAEPLGRRLLPRRRHRQGRVVDERPEAARHAGPRVGVRRRAARVRKRAGAQRRRGGDGAGQGHRQGPVAVGEEGRRVFHALAGAVRPGAAGGPRVGPVVRGREPADREGGLARPVGDPVRGERGRPDRGRRPPVPQQRVRQGGGAVQGRPAAAAAGTVEVEGAAHADERGRTVRRAPLRNRWRHDGPGGAQVRRAEHRRREVGRTRLRHRHGDPRRREADRAQRRRRTVRGPGHAGGVQAGRPGAGARRQVLDCAGAVRRQDLLPELEGADRLRRRAKV
ncbi:MAG: hypothetical protein AVDCRST_MAG64-2981, partial [uncultured Phycisphaerae bacterium]